VRGEGGGHRLTGLLKLDNPHEKKHSKRHQTARALLTGSDAQRRGVSDGSTAGAGPLLSLLRGGCGGAGTVAAIYLGQPRLALIYWKIRRHWAAAPQTLS
jgi:hypothetical protein